MRDQILKTIRDAVGQNDQLVSQYGHSVSQEPLGSVQLNIGALSLVKVSEVSEGWRIVSARYSGVSSSSLGINAETVPERSLLSALSRHLDHAFRDLGHNHEVWRNLAII